MCKNIKDPVERRKCQDRQKKPQSIKVKSKDDKRADAYNKAKSSKGKKRSLLGNIKKAATGTIWNLD